MKKLKFIFSLIGTMIFSGCSFDDEIKALKTLKKLDDGLYFIEYIGDYDFDALEKAIDTWLRFYVPYFNNQKTQDCACDCCGEEHAESVNNVEE